MVTRLRQCVTRIGTPRSDHHRPMDPQPHLDEDELDRLDAFLRSSSAGKDPMDLSMLDGFLVALAVGPSNLPPALWLPQVWGHGVTWSSPSEEKEMRALVLREANAILFQLRKKAGDFEPLLWEREHAGRPVPAIAEWCRGFVRGMALDEAGWQPLREDPENHGLLDVILLHGTEEGARELENDPTLEDNPEGQAALLAECVPALLAYWLPQRRHASTLRHEAPRVGRNDPCPCGSGRKFKRCCGASGRLH